MAKLRWLVSGVGRSGTTLTYSVLLSAARAEVPNTLGRYEPFLWGEQTWDKLPSEFGDAFSRTDAISAAGIFAHKQIPLFLDSNTPQMRAFLDETLPRNRSVVAKLIRGAGRLAAFLEHDPDLKIVHLVRNPLDVVNSALLHFSFFGGEFHKSDEARFEAEAQSKFPGVCRQIETEPESIKALEWWRLMNEAALKSAEQYSDRLMVYPYERLMEDVAGGMAEIISFLGGQGTAINEELLSEKVGPVTHYKCVRACDRDEIMPFVNDYFSDQRIFSREGDASHVSAWRSKLHEKYAACVAGPPFAPGLVRNLAPTVVRNIAAKAQQEAHSARVAGEGQVVQIVDKVAKRQKADVVPMLEKAISEVVSLKSELESTNTNQLKRLLELEKSNEDLHQQCQLFSEHNEALEKKIRQAEKARMEAQYASERDLKAAQALISKLRDRVTRLQDERDSKKKDFEKLRVEMRSIEDKLRKSDVRLRSAVSDRERYRQQLTELSAVLAPRLSTIASLRPLRFVLRQRQRVKAGLVEVDANGVVGPRSK
ncbi:sulfotransferase [Hyphomonas atlantica]